MKVLILIVATLVVGALCSEQCVPGTTFKEDCNTCRCGENGLKACTRKMCTSVEAVVADEPYARNDNTTTTTNGSNGGSSSSTTESITSADEKEEVAEHTNGQVCTPNEIKMKDCNRCRCANNGIGWFCTRKACPPREKRSTVEHQQEECSPGTTFESEDGCSECICTPDSKAVCTDKPCEARPKRDTNSGAGCTPGTSFKSADGCNDCYCSDDGVALCTLKSCEPKPAPYRRRRRASPAAGKQECVPGTTFKDADGCNDCFCSNDGRAACTLKACEPHPPAYSRRRRSSPTKTACVPGEKKMAADGCNQCTCSNDGLHYACTRLACGPAPGGEGSESVFFKREAPAPPKQECVPGTNFKASDGCNECFCTDDGRAACTLIDCEPHRRSRRTSPPKPELAPSQECVPGSTFKDADGCNDCFCSNDGRAACTLKLCQPNPAPYSRRRRASPTETKIECTPGEKKMAADGCNQCTCSNDGLHYACTRLACAGQGSESVFFKREAPLLPTPQCTPGETRMHEDGCNKCRCTAAGVLACTRKWCDHGNEKNPATVHKREATTELPRSELAPGSPGFSCTPRSSFKYQCNTCVCNDDGKHAGCTFKFCIPGEY
ncbi:kielin/chordin-like protein [Anopheles aquasalis]|uniref:kielin/chordin-like protein n=1 Tax=Anopheles aquasalis TaxID=42839 RepID=UPI00215A4B5E|nr:kielin/chordin-like protein [Anopheles aquasalis]